MRGSCSLQHGQNAANVLGQLSKALSSHEKHASKIMDLAFQSIFAGQDAEKNLRAINTALSKNGKHAQSFFDLANRSFKEKQDAARNVFAANNAIMDHYGKKKRLRDKTEETLFGRNAGHVFKYANWAIDGGENAAGKLRDYNPSASKMDFVTQRWRKGFQAGVSKIKKRF